MVTEEENNNELAFGGGVGLITFDSTLNQYYILASDTKKLMCALRNQSNETITIMPSHSL